jgi:thiamine phosphate synthase YjbQ (UPF0047 family)
VWATPAHACAVPSKPTDFALELAYNLGSHCPMPVFQKEIVLATRGRCDVRDITAEVARIVAASGIGAGIVNISGVGSTLGITTIEFEPGCVADLERALELIAPSNNQYAHNARWGDENGYAHLRSTLMGTAKSFPSGNK